MATLPHCGFWAMSPLPRPTDPMAPTTLDQCGTSVPAGRCSWSRSDLTGCTSIYGTKLLGSHTQPETLREHPQLGLWLAASVSWSYHHGQEHGLSVNEPAGKPVSSSSGKCTGLRRAALSRLHGAGKPPGPSHVLHSCVRPPVISMRSRSPILFFGVELGLASGGPTSLPTSRGQLGGSSVRQKGPWVVSAQPISLEFFPVM